MIACDKLILIRDGFRLELRGFTAAPLNLDTKVASIEIDPYTSAVGCLVALVHEHVREDTENAKHWLLTMIFTNKKIVFIDLKDAYVHVMTSLDTLIAVTKSLVGENKTAA